MKGDGERDTRRLRILLIAYEFPPSPSPQSLRWAYLANRLAAAGHDVHVLAPDIGDEGAGGLPAPEAGLQVHRIHPGWVRGLLAKLERRRPVDTVGGMASADDGAVVGDAFADLGPVEPPRLNWKGKLMEGFQDAVSWLLFPDLRGEWARPARRALPGLLDRLHPDVVLTSHEPATTLLLGLRAKSRGLSWVADLGDPVLAPYTPTRWRRKALALERKALRGADHVLVTTVETRELMRQRHGDAAPVSVVPQGFDDRLGAVPMAQRAQRNEGPVELLYAGSFYVFRDPGPLVEGVLQTRGVRLNIASGNVPGWLVHLAAAHPDQLRLLGRVPHRRLLDLQRDADVLVNIANADPAQIPGKVYEYFGACRPILHLQASEGDAVGELLGQLRRGVACAGERDAVTAAVNGLAGLVRAGRLGQEFDLAPGSVAAWGWTALARRVERVLMEVCGRPAGDARAEW